MSLDWMVWQGLFEEEPSEWKSDLIGRREACRDWGGGWGAEQAARNWSQGTRACMRSGHRGQRDGQSQSSEALVNQDKKFCLSF